MRTLSTLLIALALTACDTSTVDGDPADARSSPLGTNMEATDADAIAQIHRATARYHQVERALADGYALPPDSPCVAAVLDDGTEVAAMGYHYVNFGLIDGTIDPSAPEILLYEPMKNGRLRLVAVEFMTPADAWDPAAPPTFDGVEFDAHLILPDPENGVVGNTHGIPFPHYDLHVWSWRNNPDGMFSPMNPNVSCAHAPAPAS